MKTLLLISFFIPQLLLAQELFPSTEQATTLPKKTISPRLSYQHYQEPLGRSKNWVGLRLMYGLTKTLTVIGTVSISNHHVKTYPGNLFEYFKNHHKKIYPAFPYLAEGVHLYAKQRIFKKDGPKKHFRISLYGEASKVFAVHDNAEPNLMGDNSGIGAGIILTKLSDRFAISFTGGFIHAFKYKDSIVSFESGDAMNFTLSAGYRIYPKKYIGYDDLNINVYIELFEKNYGAAKIKNRNVDFVNERFLPDDPYTYNSLIANNYLEMRPAIQFILSSDLRFDLGMAVPLYKKSYLYYTPMLFINIQKYIFAK